MVAVFIHGVPETFRVWDQVRSSVTRDDTVALALPGFSCPVPSGWTATKEEYVAWTINQLEELGASSTPIDLVGHDWGCLIAQRVVSTRPDLIRTWAVGSGPIDETYVWHDTAQAWQTPELGEQVMAMMTPEMMAVALEPELGSHAAPLAEHVDELMRDCILKLYRSAITVGDEWQRDVEALGNKLPALVIWGSDDTYAPPIMGQRLAARVGGRYLELSCGHFWPLLEASQAASALDEFWAQ